MRAEPHRATLAVVRVFGATLTIVVALSWACADFESTVDPTGGLPDVEVADPSFAADIQPMFDRRCAIGGCHTVLSQKAELVLQRGQAYDAIVNIPAFLDPGFLRVEPGNAADSWLVRMIGPDDNARQGFARMPLGSHPLTPNQIATIVNWIENGAPEN